MISHAAHLIGLGDTDAARATLRHSVRRQQFDQAYTACDVLVAGGHHEGALAFYESGAARMWCDECDQSGRVDTVCTIEGVSYDAEYFTSPVKVGDEVAISGDCSCGLRHQPTHGLCNRIARVAELTTLGRRHRPPAQRVFELWNRCGRLWDPVDWFGWLQRQEGWILCHAGPNAGGPPWDHRHCDIASVHLSPTEMMMDAAVVHWDGRVECGEVLPHLPIVPECVGAGVKRGACYLCEPSPCSSPFTSDDNRCPRCNGTGHCPRCAP